MESKTLEELRGLARAAGVRGYSSMKKKDLVEVLKKSGAPQTASAKNADRNGNGKRKTETKKASTKSEAPTTPVASKAHSSVPSSSPTSATMTPRPNASEERIEGSKYELTPPGVSFQQSFEPSSLVEDIDRLPELGESVLRLLPQKPGVMHAYWVLERGADLRSLRLRLCRAGTGALELLDEIPVNAERGHWYFHAPLDADAGDYIAQLGHYDTAGHFITAIHRGIARIPSLYASDRTDRSWWISEEQFRALYMSGGGKVSGRRLGWAGGAPSSPGKAPNAPSSKIS